MLAEPRCLISAPPTVERMAQDIRSLMAHYDLEYPVLVGHSMGALTVWEYVRQFGCDNIRDSILHVYKGTDHSPHLWERERFVRDLREFIEG